MTPKFVEFELYTNQSLNSSRHPEPKPWDWPRISINVEHIQAIQEHNDWTRIFIRTMGEVAVREKFDEVIKQINQ